MSNKRYYWLKLKEDFFEQDEIKVVESMENGKDYIIFYLKLVLKSINTGGELRFKEAIPYDDKMLSTITGTNIDVVRSAIKLFSQLGMIEIWDDGTLYMLATEAMIGSESSSAKRVRRHRENKVLEQKREPKALQCNGDVTKGNTDIDTDKEKERDTDKESLVPAKAGTSYSDAFESWWSLYPRKIGKGKAYQAWKKEKLDGRIEELLEKLKLQIEYQYRFTDNKFIPHAATYLNGKRYDDEVEYKGAQNERRITNGNAGRIQDLYESAVDALSKVDPADFDEPF